MRRRPSVYLWLSYALTAAAGLALAGCPYEPLPVRGWGGEPTICQDGVSCCTQQELTCTGDPDGTLVCICPRSWSCAGGSTCSQDQPDTPDGGTGWSCSVDQELGQEQCERAGSAAPAGKNGWTCTVEEGQVICRRETNTPDGGSGWDCSYSGGTKSCKRQAGGGGSGVPGVVPKTGSSGGGSCSTDPPDVLIVLDHSGSMAMVSGAQSNWGQAVQAVNQLVGAHAKTIRFGLLLFPLHPPQPGSSSCAGGQVNVAVGASTQSAIASALSAATPSGSTPIDASLQNALTHLVGIDPGKPKHVLLVTDGGETCGGVPLDRVKALYAAQIKTYVVGFGYGVSVTELASLALAGGTGLSGATPYYQADDLTQLDAAFSAIAGQVCK